MKIENIASADGPFHLFNRSILMKFRRRLLRNWWDIMFKIHFFPPNHSWLLNYTMFLRPLFLMNTQIEEGMVLKVAGALVIEHPLILPCVKEVVRFLFACWSHGFWFLLSVLDHECWVIRCIVLYQVGTTDSVMGLPRELTEKLLKQVLASA